MIVSQGKPALLIYMMAVALKQIHIMILIGQKQIPQKQINDVEDIVKENIKENPDITSSSDWSA